MRLGKGIREIKLINLQIEGMQEIEMFFFFYKWLKLKTNLFENELSNNLKRKISKASCLPGAN